MKWSKQKIQEKQKKYNGIIKMRKDGYSLRAIAGVFNMTQEGVRWIVKNKREKEEMQSY